MLAELPTLGNYFSPVKVAVFVIFSLAWAVTTAWADKDTTRSKLPKQPWNAIVFGGGALGIALWILLPGFALGLIAFLLFFGGATIGYVLVRNRRVAPGQQVLTLGHLKRLTSKKTPGEDTVA